MSSDLAPPPADPIQAVVHPDPYPYYRRLARDRPCYRDEALGLWVASAPAVIRAVLDHPAARVRPLHEPVPTPLRGGPAGTLFGRFVRMNDGPGQATLKPILAQYLGELPATAPPCWPAQPHDRAGLDRFLFDAPVYAMAAWLGLPPPAASACAQDIARFRASLRPTASPDDIATGHAAAVDLQQRLAAHLDAQPDNVSLGRLRHRATRAGIATATVVANLAGLLFQSCEAGAGLIGNTLVALGRDATLAAAARRDAGGACLQAAMHSARHDPPVHNTRRYLAAPVALRGHETLPAEATVLLVLAAAGAAEPQDAPWTFGAGRHACPGHAPALQTAAQAVAHLLRAGWEPAALPALPAYWPLPNARIPRYAVPG